MKDVRGLLIEYTLCAFGKSRRSGIIKIHHAYAICVWNDHCGGVGYNQKLRNYEAAKVAEKIKMANEVKAIC